MKNVFDYLWILGECSYGWEEVAVSYVLVDDVVGLDFIIEKSLVVEELWNSFPISFYIEFSS